MKLVDVKLISLLAACLVAGCGARNQVRMMDAALPSHKSAICMLPGLLSVENRYRAIGEVKSYMHHYGSVEDTHRGLAEEARKIGADAVMNVSGGQTMGWWLGGVVRPQSRGIAVKLEEPQAFDCTKAGGTFR